MTPFSCPFCVRFEKRGAYCSSASFSSLMYEHFALPTAIHSHKTSPWWFPTAKVVETWAKEHPCYGLALAHHNCGLTKTNRRINTFPL